MEFPQNVPLYSQVDSQVELTWNDTAHLSFDIFAKTDSKVNAV